MTAGRILAFPTPDVVGVRSQLTILNLSHAGLEVVECEIAHFVLQAAEIHAEWREEFVVGGFVKGVALESWLIEDRGPMETKSCD
jgi:hypothetical protein